MSENPNSCLKMQEIRYLHIHKFFFKFILPRDTLVPASNVPSVPPNFPSKYFQLTEVGSSFRFTDSIAIFKWVNDLTARLFFRIIWSNSEMYKIIKIRYILRQCPKNTFSKIAPSSFNFTQKEFSNLLQENFLQSR